jgi:hypothetical protein
VPLERGSSTDRRNEAKDALYHEFLLDVYLSAGAAFRTEAATNLIQQQQDGHDGINTPGDTQMRKAAEYLAKVSRCCGCGVSASRTSATSLTRWKPS